MKTTYKIVYSDIKGKEPAHLPITLKTNFRDLERALRACEKLNLENRDVEFCVMKDNVLEKTMQIKANEFTFDLFKYIRDTIQVGCHDMDEIACPHCVSKLDVEDEIHEAFYDLLENIQNYPVDRIGFIGISILVKMLKDFHSNHFSALQVILQAFDKGFSSGELFESNKEKNEECLRKDS
jgi:hypothetical protein